MRSASANPSCGFLPRSVIRLTPGNNCIAIFIFLSLRKLFNPAAFTHTSIAILDALNTYEPPVIEVHISQVHKREAFRHHSYVSLRADGVIAGLGLEGYAAGVRRICQLASSQPQ